MLKRRTPRPAGSSVSGEPTANTTSNQAPPMPQTFSSDTPQGTKGPKEEGRSAQPVPWTAANVKEALGIDLIDLNDPNVEVKFVLVPYGTALGAASEAALAKSFDTIFPSQPVTEPVTDADETAKTPIGWDLEMLNHVLQEVADEVHRASEKHEPMHSPHEGYAVIKEELEELWEEIRADTGRTVYARKEAIQVAAMAVRYLLDIDPA